MTSNKFNLIIDSDSDGKSSYNKIYVHPYFFDQGYEKNKKVIEKHWKDVSNFQKDNIYLEKIRLKILNNLKKLLNNFHKKKFSNRFWEIHLGYWIHSYSMMMLERWRIVDSLCSKEGTFYVDFKRFSEIDMIPQSLDEINNIYYLNDYSAYLFYTIINERNKSVKKFSTNYLNNKEFQIPLVRKKFNQHDKSIREKLLKIYYMLFSRIIRRQKYAIIRSYLGIKDDIKLNFNLYQLPMFVPNNYYLCEPDFNLRKKINFEFNSEDEFERFLYKKMHLFLPVNFLEGFEVENSKIKNIPLPEKPKKIFSCNILLKSLLSRYCANKVEEGSKLILAPHGGCFGHFDIHFPEKQEHNISDLYLTWGGKQKNNSNEKPFGITRPLIKKILNSKKDLLTMIIPNTPIFDGYLHSEIRVDDYLKPGYKIIEGIEEEIKNNNLLVRFVPRDFGKSDFKRFQNKFPEIRKDLQQIKFDKIISRTRIFLSPYLGTGYLETLAMNVPTVVFSSASTIKDEAKKYYNILKDAKIFFEDETDLSKHINNIWYDHLSWWNAEKVQKAKKIFCDKYAYINKNKLSDLKNILIK